MSKLKEWASKRWTLKGQLTGALKAVNYHFDNTPLSPVEEKTLDELEEMIEFILDHWEDSQALTRTECLIWMDAKRSAAEEDEVKTMGEDKEPTAKKPKKKSGSYRTKKERQVAIDLLKERRERDIMR